MQQFLGIHRGYFTLIFAILLCLFFQFYSPPDDFPPLGWKLLGITFMMIIFWISEWVPFAVTALIPLLLFPVCGIASLKEAAVQYANPVIFLFLGGFLIAISLEKTDLHKRIALNIIKRTGSSFTGVLLGFMLATALLSMWMSNTATTVMMMAIAVPAIKTIFSQDENPAHRTQFATFLLLSIAYCSSIGGIATIIGTPTNAVLYGLLESTKGIELGFVQWIGYALPIAVLMFLFLYFYYRAKLKPLNNRADSPLIKAMAEQPLKELGKLNKAQKIVGVIFLLIVFLWIFRSLINDLFGTKVLDDTVIALLGGVLPFLIPVKFGTKSFIVKWEDTLHLPWNILLLFGGGLSLAAAMESTGLVNWAANWMVNSSGSSLILMSILLPALMLFLTELMGNVALASLFLPLTIQISTLLGVPVEYFAFPATIAASFAFMLPISTPPNAIVYGLGYFSINQMIKGGFWLNIVGLIIVCLYNYVYFFVFKM
ncbi:MAG: DASS family sodium-coupled anion symporter [Saprospiraceae bacterium]|nr:DASS family sodium-coupled anion symporter [Saprospiraceae bacterium]